MKSILAIITLTVVNAFAGNGGGTMMKKEDLIKGKTIVYHIGQKEGITAIGIGKPKNTIWDIKKVALTDDEMREFPELATAVQESGERREWVQVQTAEAGQPVKVEMND